MEHPSVKQSVSLSVLLVKETVFRIKQSVCFPECGMLKQSTWGGSEECELETISHLETIDPSRKDFTRRAGCSC